MVERCPKAPKRRKAWKRKEGKKVGVVRSSVELFVDQVNEEVDIDLCCAVEDREGVLVVELAFEKVFDPEV